ncbi:hypothetical protein ACOSQ2_021649 [Xanthoceras sorbifolium]
MESLEIIKKSLLSARSMSIGSSESDGKATASGLMGLLADLLGLFLGAGLLGLFVGFARAVCMVAGAVAGCSSIEAVSGC